RSSISVSSVRRRSPRTELVMDMVTSVSGDGRLAFASHRMTQVSSLAAEERRTWLLQELQASRAVSLVDAATNLGVSEMTVRRDLSNLEKSGVARRVRGGAVYNGPVSFQGRDREHAEAKHLIAEKLLPFVPERGVIA